MPRKPRKVHIAEPPVAPEWPTGTREGDKGFLCVQWYPEGSPDPVEEHWEGTVGKNGGTTWERRESGPVFVFKV